ncbi:hypothetical protein [Extensimonas vulgaris]|uniref:Uncharacterized protein n=1 Tax=Extensimonas vulgaris TaxID=1031594 RepID=A0A369AR60_9BURK|nr:hypothetical protein [Extensimonas vulgaris]MBC7215678.1 hypothetical protein [Burkholderiaceae bacterium]RCX10707.1 hypothetical protein DFR45_102108 [Extensimonas vulgaris]TWI41349.1 hypothetical protein IP95_00106 [Extensimonas vulgaris]TXD16818.1 hypothetical protein FUT63_02165 [Extensimonas vulgaris]
MYDHAANASTHDLHAPGSAENVCGNTKVATDALRASCGVLSCPPDLTDFVHAKPLSEAARALNLTRWTIRRLRNGYWPRDAGNILSAWACYKAEKAVVTSWFLRRVRAGGVVRHAGAEFGAPYLTSCTGQMVAVARMGHDLVAQTLELPAQRFTLFALHAADKGR